MNVDHIPELKKIQEKTGYIASDPGLKKVYYLEVIKKLRWREDGQGDVNIDLEIGSLTWVDHFVEGCSVLIENNRYSINFDSFCFRLIEVKDIQEEDVFYRFKTEEEFKKEGLWNKSSNAPYSWNNQGSMNKYLGTSLSALDLKKVRKMIKNKEAIVIDSWCFNERDFIYIKDNSKTKDKTIGVTKESHPAPTYSKTTSIKPSLMEIYDEIVIESTINITI